MLYGTAGREVLAVGGGALLEAYEAAGGAVDDWRELDFGDAGGERGGGTGARHRDQRGGDAGQALSDLTGTQTGTVTTTGRGKK